MKSQKQLNEEYCDKFVMAILIMAIVLACIMACENAEAQELTIEDQIKVTAMRNGVDPNLALAIATVESQLNPAAIGSLGEIGLFQLRPEFHDVRVGNSRHNIDVATRYLSKLMDKCRHYGDAFFVCFNYGPARKLKHPRLFPYYVKVKAVQRKLESEANAAIAQRD